MSFFGFRDGKESVCVDNITSICFIVYLLSTIVFQCVYCLSTAFSAVLDVASFDIVANPITANHNTSHIPDMAPIEERILMPWIPSSTAMSTRIISAVSSMSGY